MAFSDRLLVVQVMSNSMTSATCGEFGQESSWMRYAVAVFTFWNHFMLIFVTGGTGKISMFDLAVDKQIVGSVMTCSTMC